MGYSEYERQVMDTWPTVTEADTVKLNDLFTHYIFFRRIKGDKLTLPATEFHASCCGHQETILRDRRTEYPWELDLLLNCHHGQSYTCPWCGRHVTMKDLSKAGQRKNLREFREVLLLHLRDGVLYADALWTRKIYETEEELAGPVRVSICSGYRFAKGEVMQLDHQHWGECPAITYEGGSLSRRKMVQEPFKVGSISCWRNESYQILNREVLDSSEFFRYSQFFSEWQYIPGGGRGYRQKFGDFVSYLTAYCIYPRQVEMLMKSGLWQLVHDLVYSRKKNVAVMCWEDPDIRKSMDLNKQELALVMGGRVPLDALAVRNYVRKHWDKRWSLAFCTDFIGFWENKMDVLRFLKRFRLDPDRFLRYVGAVYDEQASGMEVMYADIFQIYKDYIESAYAAGWCMEHSDVLWPKQLYTAHTQATTALDCRAVFVGTAADGAKRKLKYEFEMDGLRIVFPVMAGAIKREGKMLDHCVGGYAERHMKGVLTILFLRKSDAPGMPYVTIEMNGNRIAQIHGYSNDRGAISPKVTHKEFLDKWLAWLAAGSKRNEDGSPKLPRPKKKAVAVA